jgi:hypothetical protein
VVHLEQEESWGSLGEGRIEARESLLALADLRLEPGDVEG